MSIEMYVQRNDALVFAQNTLANLKLTEDRLPGHPDFHPVTQLINSLLGLVVFTQEKHFIDYVAKQHLKELEEKGWPQIAIAQDESKRPTTTLGDLIRHLRNAIAHGRMIFSSDSHDLAEVTITAEDAKSKHSAPYWTATMTAVQLRELCLKMVDLLVNVIG